MFVIYVTYVDICLNIAAWPFLSIEDAIKASCERSEDCSRFRSRSRWMHSYYILYSQVHLNACRCYFASLIEITASFFFSLFFRRDYRLILTNEVLTFD